MQAATATKKKSTKLTWAEVARQPTGRAMCDSGDFYGRHWERPLPQDGIKISHYESSKELMPSIPLHRFLDEHFEIDHKLTRWLRRECEKQSRYGYQEYAELLAEKLGLAHLAGDYTYNWENDLSQDFQFTVVGPSGADWVWSDECYLIIQTHNGCDARGGFSDPVVCKASEPGAWLDVVCGVWLDEGTDADGTVLDREALQALDEEWQIGYTSAPASRFNGEIAEVISCDETGNKFTVRLKSGETVSGSFCARDSNGGFL